MFCLLKVINLLKLSFHYKGHIMNMNNIGQNYLSQNTTQPKAGIDTQYTEPTPNSVNISNKGQNTLIKENLSGLEGLEQFQVAPWLADYTVTASTELGGKGQAEFGSKVVGQSDYEKSNYASLAQKEFNAVLGEAGISSQKEYYNALIVDEDYSAALHERFLERMNKVNEQLYSKLS